ncbi:hypothetical protein ACX80I_17255, partial [Arthrobacter sp. MDT3-44]
RIKLSVNALQTQGHHPGKRATPLHKIRNQPKKPATTHRGARQPANSTNQKTIGINKLGTLLSSQTTGTNDYLQAARFHALSGLFSLVVTFTAYFILFSLVKSPAVPYRPRKRIRQNNPTTNTGPNSIPHQSARTDHWNWRGLVTLTGATT